MFGNYHYPVFIFAAVKGFNAVFFDLKKLYPVKIGFNVVYEFVPKFGPSAFKNGYLFAAKIVGGYFFLVGKAVVYGNRTADFCFRNFNGFYAEFFRKLFVTDIYRKVDIVSDAFEHGVHVLVRSSEKNHAGFYVSGCFMNRKPFCRHEFIRKSIHDSDFDDVGTALLNVFCALDGIVIVLDKGF